MKNKRNTGSGKGDRPRNNYSQQFRDNYDRINWKKSIWREVKWDKHGK